MPQLLSLSRAARLAGVSRGELQEKIRSLALETFEGQIQMGDLLRVYPHIDPDEDPVFERVQAIKTLARPKRKYSDGWLPEPEVLMSRLREFQEVLVRTKSDLNAAQDLLSELTQALGALAQIPDAGLREAVAQLTRGLRTASVLAGPARDARAELFAKDALLKIMAAAVHVRPSGHEFFVEGSDSILEAALKAGLHLEYGCSSGNCGSCKARVISGRARKVRDHDYVLSAREQEEGYILSCSNTAVTDLVLEAPEAQNAGELPHQQIRASVKQVELIEPDLAMLRLQTPRTQTLRFMAGQRVRLTAEDGAWADLPIASCPCDGRNLQFMVRRRGDDAFARAVFAPGIVSQTLELAGPVGTFTLREESIAPAIFVAVGDGFAAIKSLVEHAIAIDNAARIHLYRLDRPGTAHPLHRYCRAWADALDNFRCSSLPAETPAGDLLTQVLADQGSLRVCDVYVCAPAAWIDSLLAAARRVGLDTTGWLRDALA